MSRPSADAERIRHGETAGGPHRTEEEGEDPHGAEGRGELDEAAEIVARMSDATLLRSVAAIVVGFIVLTLGSVAAGRVIVGALGQEAGAPVGRAFLAWSLGSRLLVALLAGYLTARAAPRRPFAHGAALAGVLAFLALAAVWGLSSAGVVEDPAWYPAAMVFLGPVGVLAGAGLRAHRLRPRRLPSALVVVLVVGLVSCVPPPSDTAVERGSPAADTGAAASDSGGGEEDTRVLRGERNFLTDYPARVGENEIHMVVEIPAGTNAKWETTKTGDAIEWELGDDDRLRVVQYLAYPGNYGMIPRTLLPAPMGGDGDPLDVILLGPTLPRGSVVPARPVGVLKLLDTGERDDKIIAVPLAGLFSEVHDVDRLRDAYPGALDILERWFASYKGPGVMEAGGTEDAAAARAVIEQASDAYEAWAACGDLTDEQGHGPDPFGEEWWGACRRRMEAAGGGTGS